ncbi:MAG TPA: methionyl-tRNA formyltransferase, partial [Patescibacteria group bacterium]|nr:methionyl-tRNA formyltransferase [Patescibacteria group bacterium]
RKTFNLNMNPIRVLFYGTSSFAVPILSALINDDRFSVVGVVTQPDRPIGRHAELQAPPVKQKAVEFGLPVLQFEKIKSEEAFTSLHAFEADVAVVASFGQIIPQRVLDLTKFGMVNVHGSLLPQYRGASPIAAAIKNGDSETGVTIMKMDALMDHGPLLAFAAEPIRPDDSTPDLERRLAMLGAKILPDVLFNYVNGTIQPQEQDHTKATAVKLLSRDDGKLDWTCGAGELERTVRAYTPWPGTFTVINGQRLKINRASVGETFHQPIGTHVIDTGEPAIVCGDHRALRFIEVQPEGKQKMNGKAYLTGHPNWNK